MNEQSRLVLLFSIFTLLICEISSAGVTRFLAGNASDVSPELHGPAHDFQGGGTDVDAALQWMIDQVRGCTDCVTKLDVVVLRASGDNDYNDYLLAMKGVDSVETLVITAREDSQRKDVIQSVRNAEIIFFAGGDQCNYVRNFKDTPVEDAVKSVYARGGGIGGTSAGIAMQGDFSYDACTGSTKSSEGLSNPFHESISFTSGFFQWPHMESTITDTHLVERDRMGRTFAFLARQIRDGRAKSVWSLAVNRETALAIDKDGMTTVMGKGPAYFILADHKPELCEPGRPLTYSNYKIWKVDSGGRFDLKKRPTSGYYLRSVRNGIIDKDPYAEIPCDPMPKSLGKHLQLIKANLRSNEEKAKKEFETVVRLCPMNLEVYTLLENFTDQAFIKANAGQMRYLVEYSTTPERLRYYALLWRLEWKTHKPEEEGDLKKEIEEDKKSLQGRDQLKDLLSWHP